jgi:hypothetical protein
MGTVGNEDLMLPNIFDRHQSGPSTGPSNTSPTSPKARPDQSNEFTMRQSQQSDMKKRNSQMQTTFTKDKS